MKLIILLAFVSTVNTLIAQQYPWTGKCDQAQSVAEMNEMYD